MFTSSLRAFPFILLLLFCLHVKVKLPLLGVFYDVSVSVQKATFSAAPFCSVQQLLFRVQPNFLKIHSTMYIIKLYATKWSSFLFCFKTKRKVVLLLSKNKVGDNLYKLICFKIKLHFDSYTHQSEFGQTCWLQLHILFILI